jgi:hypothetical protein
MRHIGPDVEPDATVALRHASCQTYGIAQKDVVRAGLDEQRGEPGEVGEQRARRLGIRRRHVVVSTTPQRLHRQERIDVGLAVQRRTRERQVHPRGHQADARRLGQPTRLCSHERRGYQPPARSHRYHLDRHLLPTLGRRQIAAITVDDVARPISAPSVQGRAPRTTVGVLATLGSILRLALRRGYIAEDPMLRLEAGERPRLDPRLIDLGLDVAQVSRILGHAGSRPR